MKLARIYYAQRSYRQKHGRWAANIAELGIENAGHESIEGPPQMQVTQSGFEVVVVVRYPGEETRRWHIRQDSRVWAD